MANKVKFKRSGIAAVVPAAGVAANQIDVGEIGLNLADEKLFFQNAAGAMVSITSDQKRAGLTGPSIPGRIFLMMGG